jgi:RNA polymerase sigma-70 factor (ECF subfamily)
LTDEEIIERFRNHDERNYIFNLLVRKYQQKLYWVIRRLVIDHDDANDIAQNVWLKAYNGLHKFKAASQLYTWLYRIAANESLTFLRKKKKRFFLPLNDVEAELSRKVENDPSVAPEELQLKFQKAILTLPEKQRLVFHMRYYDEMPYEEMSRVLGTSEGALKASYHIAVKKIKEIITSEH